MPAQQPRAERMEGAEPQPLDALAEQARDAADHLARGLVGEGHREHLIGPRPAGQQHVREARGQHPGLAGAGAGQHQERPVRRLDRRALLRVEAVEIAPRRRRRRRPACPLDRSCNPCARPTGRPEEHAGTLGRQGAQDATSRARRRPPLEVHRVPSAGRGAAHPCRVRARRVERAQRRAAVITTSIGRARNRSPPLFACSTSKESNTGNVSTVFVDDKC